LLKAGTKATLYTIQLNGEEENEFDKFLQDPDVISSPHLGPFLERINDIADRFGCQEQFFKLQESDFYNPVVALWRDNLRLYCCRYGNIILIIGSGGIKKTRTYQEDPKLKRIVEIMASVAERIDQKMKDKEIEINKNDQFIGDLNFD
jgi:hypothetical protein